MSKIHRETYRLHARLPAFRRLVARARGLLEEQLDETASVAFSAGKDSTVVAHLCHSVRPGIHMLCVDPGTPWHWTEDERRMWLEYADAQGWALRLFPWDKWGDVGIASARDERQHQRAAHTSMWHDMHAWQREHGLTTIVMGLRANESIARRWSIRVRGQVYEYSDHPVYRRAVLPIAHWATRDVWAYLVDHNLPWLEIYDLIGPDARNGWVSRSGGAELQAELRRASPDIAQAARTVLPTDLF